MGDFMAASDSTSTGSAESTASTVSKPLNATGASSSVFGSAPVISSGQSGTAASKPFGTVDTSTATSTDPKDYEEVSEGATHIKQNNLMVPAFTGATHKLIQKGGRRSPRASRRGGKRASRRGGSRSGKRGGKRASKRGGKRSSRRGGSRASRR